MEVIGNQIEPSAKLSAAHNDSIETIAARPDGKEMATGSHDHLIKLWDPERLKNIRLLQSHTSGVWALDYSPDGSLLLSGSADNTLALWDTKVKSPVKVLKGHDNKVYWTKFNAGGNLIASCGENTQTIIWDVTMGSVVKKLGKPELTYCVQWAKDNSHLITTNYDGQINVYDVLTYDPVTSFRIQTVKHRRINGCDTEIINPNNARIFTACQDRVIRQFVLKQNSLNLVKSTQGYHFDQIKSVSLYPKKRLMLSTTRDGAIRVWNVGNSISVRCTLVGHEDNVSKATFIPNNNIIVASGGWDQRINVWKIKADS